MGGVGLVMASVIGGSLAAVGAVITGILGIIGPAIGAAFAAVSSVIASIDLALSSVIGQVLDPLWKATLTIGAQLGTAIGNLTTAITTAAAPVLMPIKESLEAISAVFVGINAAVDTALAPIAEIRMLIQNVATVKVLSDLLRGTQSITRLIGLVADGQNFAIAEAIAQLTKNITVLGVGMVDKVDTEFTLLGDQLDNFEATFERSLEERTNELNATLLATITGIEDDLLERTTGVNRRVTAISRRLEDLPWFKEMLVRALI